MGCGEGLGDGGACGEVWARRGGVCWMGRIGFFGSDGGWGGGFG